MTICVWADGWDNTFLFRCAEEAVMGVPTTLLLPRRCRYVVSMTLHEGASNPCEKDASENNSSCTGW